MKKILIALVLMVPMAANALCLGSDDSRCKDKFKVNTNEGYTVKWENNNEGDVVKGTVRGNGNFCGITGGRIRQTQWYLYGQVYYTCGNLNIVRMFSGDGVNWTANSQGSFGSLLVGIVK